MKKLSFRLKVNSNYDNILQCTSKFAKRYYNQILLIEKHKKKNSHPLGTDFCKTEYPP